MRPTSLTIAYTPDSDDAFYYDALETGQVELPGYRLQFRREPMAFLNRAALIGRFDVTAISSVCYPRIADRYAILSVGTSVGRGYGPVLVSREDYGLADLAGRPVGVPGIPTTGWFLLRQLCPEAMPVEMPFDEIADAVMDGDLAAGVMIHEELLYYPQIGLRRWWIWRRVVSASRLPLPVGLNVVRRDLGPARMSQICAGIRASLEHALEHPHETIERVSRFGRGRAAGCTEQFVQMFANEDSFACPPTCARLAGIAWPTRRPRRGRGNAIRRHCRTGSTSGPGIHGFEARDFQSKNGAPMAATDRALAAKRDFLVPCVYHFYQRPPVLVRGDGAYLFDAEGRRYVDGFSGVTVMNAGHSNPVIIDAAIDQLRRLQHTTTVYLTEPMLELARTIAELAPPGLRRTFFCASGSEANEGAMLLATLATGRQEHIALDGGLHGRTKAAMSATQLDMWRTDPYPLAEVHRVPGPRDPEACRPSNDCCVAATSRP